MIAHSASCFENTAVVVTRCLRRRALRGVGPRLRGERRAKRLDTILALLGLAAMASLVNSFVASASAPARADAAGFSTMATLPAITWLADGVAGHKQAVSDNYVIPAFVLPSAGPAAQPLVIAAKSTSPRDYQRALTCMTAAIYYEAARESDDGQRGVAQVVLNRLAHPAFPKSVCGVVYQGSERTTGCQFSFACDGSFLRPPERRYWDRAEKVAGAALAGEVYGPVGLATHYHSLAVHPVWADSMKLVDQIGAHRFYTMVGAIGSHAAFHFVYTGGEDWPGPHMLVAEKGAMTDQSARFPPMMRAPAGRKHINDTHDARNDPMIVLPAMASRRATPSVADNNVLPQWRSSGSWIGQPD